MFPFFELTAVVYVDPGKAFKLITENSEPVNSVMGFTFSGQC